MCGISQMQLDTLTRVMGKKDAGEVREIMPNKHGCPSQFISMMVKAPTWIQGTKLLNQVIT